jgi:acyl carrier protein
MDETVHPPHEDQTSRGVRTMERADAFVKLREAAVEVLNVDQDQVTEDARFKEDLDADSLDLVELVMALEERFDITVPEEELEGVTTIGKSLDLVMGKIEAKG